MWPTQSSRLNHVYLKLPSISIFRHRITDSDIDGREIHLPEVENWFSHHRLGALRSIFHKVVNWSTSTGWTHLELTILICSQSTTQSINQPQWALIIGAEANCSFLYPSCHQCHPLLFMPTPQIEFGQHEHLEILLLCINTERTSKLLFLSAMWLEYMSHYFISLRIYIGITSRRIILSTTMLAHNASHAAL